METHAPTWRLLLIPITFALVCVALLIFTWHWFGGSLPFQAAGYRVSLSFPDATGLVDGSDVQIAGVDVGKVVSVRRVRSTTSVTIELANQYAPLHTAATAIARTKTLLGEGYVEITPGPRSQPAIPDNGALSADHVIPAQRLDDVLSTFTPATRASLQSLFAGLATALHGRGQQLNDTLGAAAPLTSSMDDVLNLLDGQRGDLRQLLSSSAVVLNSLGSRAGALQALVTAGDRALAATAARNQQLTATVNALPPFLTQLRRTDGTLTAATADLSGAVAQVRAVAPLLAPALSQINADAPEFRSLFRSLPSVIAAGRAGLPALTPISQAAAGAFTTLYPAARNLIPVLQLLAAIRDEAAGVFANISSVTNGTFVGPQGRILAYGGGIPDVWNETLAGWVRRLPTNRLNPYPKPGALLSIASGGLKAYDCRNLSNPLLLPPTGTGVPPCIVQGPWSFDGRSAYFPDLLPAPP
jgi:phospholipid/cholesterol/gamma-HCH transport system substrate-binding protein